MTILNGGFNEDFLLMRGINTRRRGAHIHMGMTLHTDLDGFFATLVPNHKDIEHTILELSYENLENSSMLDYDGNC